MTQSHTIPSKNTFQVIRDIGKLISDDNSIETNLNLITGYLCQLMSTEVCSIYVYSQEENTLLLAGNSGFQIENIGKFSLKPDQGITGKVFSTVECINQTVDQYKSLECRFSELNEEQLRSIISIPLVTGSQCVGVLNLQSKTAASFPTHSMKILEGIAPQIANILLNYEIFDRLTKSNENINLTTPAQDIKLSGQPVCSGVVTGQCLIVDSASQLNSIYWRKITDIEGELELYDKALSYAKEETIELEKEAAKVLTESNAEIFYAHLLIMDDKYVMDNVRTVIKGGTTVKFALKTVLLELKKEFNQIESESIRERLIDITDVFLRIIHNVDKVLRNRRSKPSKNAFHQADDKLIIIAHELFPSQLISWPLNKVAGIICETGGLTSHVAIIAKALKIPTLMGVERITHLVKQNDTILLDCAIGNCFIKPSETMLTKYSEIIKTHKEDFDFSEFSTEIDQQTTDGVKIKLFANMSLVSEIPMLKQYGSAGIGLYRTEFLFMIRNTAPTVEDQVKVYSRFAEICNEENFTIRLLDIGGDKPVPYLNCIEETNPLLGIRGVRLLLKNPRLLMNHIDAILQTSFVAPVKILIPMITTIDELIMITDIIEQRRRTLENELGRKIDNYKVGFMVETPSIIWELDKAAKLVDFISIGSNDLVQYAFAVDRNNSSAIGNFNSTNPATIKMLRMVTKTMQNHPTKPLTLCGEIASNPRNIPLLIGIGLENFSMSPWLIPEIRKTVNKVSKSRCEILVRKYIEANDQEEANKILDNFTTEQAD
ncbi:MAG: phosphoenolpyruvate--protein phosphotransferase [Lentisphaeria bacterium]|nr:phosphoenolpyruvate--protein phosphotransferase [Lentisphaeria bacterium]